MLDITKEKPEYQVLEPEEKACDPELRAQTLETKG
jgi:hypothetical protein